MGRTFWTKERIFLAIEEWEAILGRLPTSIEWFHAADYPREGEVDRWPNTSTVITRFGRWANAMDEFEKWRKQEIVRRKRKTKWDREKIIEWFQKKGEEFGGVPPSHGDLTTSPEDPPYGRVLKHFGTWGDAQEAAGFVRIPIGVSRRDIARYRPLPRRNPDEEKQEES